MKIDYLINMPFFAKQIAIWFANEWGAYNPGRSLEEWEKQLCLGKSELPLSIVGYEESKAGLTELLATATLRYGAMDGHPEFKTWLSFVFTNPDFRGKGYAREIISAAIKIAETLEIDRLHLYTRGNGNIYRKMGWTDIEFVEYKGGPVIVMTKNLMQKKNN